jgi:hypothetical protein
MTPGRVREVGTGLARTGGQLRGLAPDFLVSTVAEPPLTATALDMLAADWATGLDTLGDSVSTLGRVSIGVAGLFELIDAGGPRPG